MNLNLYETILRNANLSEDEIQRMLEEKRLQQEGEIGKSQDFWKSQDLGGDFEHGAEELLRKIPTEPIMEALSPGLDEIGNATNWLLRKAGSVKEALPDLPKALFEGLGEVLPQIPLFLGNVLQTTQEKMAAASPRAVLHEMQYPRREYRPSQAEIFPDTGPAVVGAQVAKVIAPSPQDYATPAGEVIGEFARGTGRMAGQVGIITAATAARIPPSVTMAIMDAAQQYVDEGKITQGLMRGGLTGELLGKAGEVAKGTLGQAAVGGGFVAAQGGDPKEIFEGAVQFALFDKFSKLVRSIKDHGVSESNAENVARIFHEVELERF